MIFVHGFTAVHLRSGSSSAAAQPAAIGPGWLGDGRASCSPSGIAAARRPVGL